ncbi:GTP cyclohydrolase-2 [Candidatus Blochmanniella vafra str. BVAF]|uniref:GTP cyclohydrolase-2 n=1 Tax=Blochmanniella vafra (strain BVAF) TaxID=859654 RepID=E8Q6C1_BLOVB|nr:GTP cyclohydrolase II [Candidatus Blochmannia vafer]ADV33815.1 GTP cyclohydrolase-2 [Candidatus Blochmannia vafer str. BVAF]
MRLKQVGKAKLPTLWGNFLIVGFEEKLTRQNHVALIYGSILGSEPVLTRIHSECLTGDALFSSRCDCGFQLNTALNYITTEGQGILIYHRQEGRNIGLLNKIQAYSLQDNGADTVEANQCLGFHADERDFTICADILKLLNIHTIRLLTNNPQKIKVLDNSNINIVERVPLIVGRNSKNAKYLNTKESKLGHLFNLRHKQ